MPTWCQQPRYEWKDLPTCHSFGVFCPSCTRSISLHDRQTTTNYKSYQSYLRDNLRDESDKYLVRISNLHEGILKFNKPERLREKCKWCEVKATVKLRRAAG